MAESPAIWTPPELWALHLGDCIEGMRALPDKSVDHVITDPPYSEHIHTRSRRGAATDYPGDTGSFSRTRDLGFGHIDDTTMGLAALHFSRLARRWVLVFCDMESIHLWRAQLSEHGLEPVRVGIWNKLGCTPQFTGDRPATGCEAVVIAHRPGKKRWNGGGRHARWDVPIVLERGNGESRIHTTQKPEALMSTLVRDFTDRGEIVLDPFAGSGTTGVACLRQGRRFLGWEREEKWHRAACARLERQREQMTLAMGDGR